jgi:hypothetical protein
MGGTGSEDGAIAYVGRSIVSTPRRKPMADDPYPFDFSAFSVASFAEAEAEDRAYWHAKSPQQRLAALEQMRQINYDYDPVSDRIQRVFEVVERT